MPWFMVDDDMTFHPKTLAAGNDAMGMWVRADLDAMEFELPTHTRAECGSTTGYRRHHKLGETPCDACRDAKRKARHR